MLLGAAAVWAIAAGPADVSAWAAAYDKPELGAAVDAAGQQLTWGHLTPGVLHGVLPMKDATTKDVIAITNLVTKKDYGPWFERYLLGTEWPPPEKGKQP